MNKGRVLLIVLVVVVVILLVIIALHFIIPKGNNQNSNNSNSNTPNPNTPPTHPPTQTELAKKVYASPQILSAEGVVNIRSSASRIEGFFGYGSNIICVNPNGQQLLDIVNADGTSLWSEEYWWGTAEAWYKIKIDNVSACGGATIGYVLADEVILK